MCRCHSPCPVREPWFGVSLCSDRNSFEMLVFKVLTWETEIKDRTEHPLESHLLFSENPLIQLKGKQRWGLMGLVSSPALRSDLWLTGGAKPPAQAVGREGGREGLAPVWAPACVWGGGGKGETLTCKRREMGI